jgi:hypothetical protein
MRENPAEFARQYPDFKPYQREKPSSNILVRGADKLISAQAGGYNAVVKGARPEATLRFNEFLHNEGDQKIEKIFIARKPILAGVDAVLNGLSLGGFNRTKERLGYDNAYHNFLVVQSADGTLTRLERNHIVEAFPIGKDSSEWQNEAYEIPLDGKVITSKELVENARKQEGDKFYHYDPASNNCQVFTRDLLKDSDLIKNVKDPRALEVIEPQNGEMLVNSLGALKGVPKLVTDLASRLDRAQYGDGLGIGKVASKKRDFTFRRVGGAVSVDELFHRINHGFE